MKVAIAFDAQTLHSFIQAVFRQMGSEWKQ